PAALQRGPHRRPGAGLAQPLAQQFGLGDDLVAVASVSEAHHGPTLTVGDDIGGRLGACGPPLEPESACPTHYPSPRPPHGDDEERPWPSRCSTRTGCPNPTCTARSRSRKDPGSSSWPARWPGTPKGGRWAPATSPHRWSRPT